MAQLIVRNVDEDLVRALKTRATQHGRSMEAEHREILRVTLAADVRGTSFKEWMGTMPDLGRDEDFVVPRDYPRELG
jgi:plasmid stability protein